MTLEEWVKKGETQLRLGPHPERARRDAELLLQHLLRRERAALLARWKERLSSDEASIYVRLIHRRFLGEPIQYILGETEFYGLPFSVSPDVLIPRPETEHLVEKAIELASRFAAPRIAPRIADIGTGSGAIAVALANALPASHVTAIDISPGAIDIAKKNAERNRVAERIRFLQGDLLEPAAGEQFEMIVSNPPYVSADDRDSLAVEVRDHEPAVALFAGEDGLEVIRRLIPSAFAALVPGGVLLIEIGYGQWPSLCELMADAGFTQIESVSDLQQIPRVACAEKP